MRPYQRKGKKILVRNARKANTASVKTFLVGEWRSGSRTVLSLQKKFAKFQKKGLSKDVSARAFWKYF